MKLDSNILNSTTDKLKCFILFYIKSWFYRRRMVSKTLQMYSILWDKHLICFWSFFFFYQEPGLSPLVNTQQYWSHYEIQINILLIKVPDLQHTGLYSMKGCGNVAETALTNDESVQYIWHTHTRSQSGWCETWLHQ